MEDFRKIILLMTIFSFMSVGWGQFDITPPELMNFEFTSSDTVDITDTTRTISYTLSVIDDMSGISDCHGSFRSPTYVDYLSFYNDEKFI